MIDHIEREHTTYERLEQHMKGCSFTSQDSVFKEAFKTICGYIDELTAEVRRGEETR